MKEVRMMRGARTLVDTCANVSAGERVLIVTDTETTSVAKMLAAALVERDIEPVMCVMLPREMDGQEPPPLVASAMLEADVIFIPVAVSIAHSTATKNALKRGARAIALSGFFDELLYSGGIKADFLKQKPLCDRFGQYFTDSDTINITSPRGTNFTASIKGRPGNSHSGIVRKPGELTGLTHIEANVSPVEDTSEGTIVVDGSVPNFGIGVVGTPIELTVKKGLVTEIKGGKEARFLEDILKKIGDPLVYNIAQIAVGLNPECKRLNGVMSNDHGSYGRMHFGIGTSHQLGGEVKAPIHFDVVIEAPTLSFDGEVVIKDGEVLIKA